MISVAASMTFISLSLSQLFATTHHPTRSSPPGNGSASLAALWDAVSTMLELGATSTTTLTNLALSTVAASAAEIQLRTLMEAAPSLSSRTSLQEACTL